MANKPRSKRETNNLIRLREESGLTQADVAKHLGISVYTYSRAEKHPERMRADRIATLSKMLGVTSDTINAPLKRGVQLASNGRSVTLYDLDGESLKDTGKQQIYNAGLPHSAIAVRANDSSMTGNISEGDIVLINPEKPLDPGSIVLARAPVNRELVLRFYTPLHPSDERAPGFILRSSSNLFPEIISTKTTSGEILGRAISVIHEL